MAKELYDPKAFIIHAASQRQTFVHCARFPVAATRRCIGRVSVLFWGVTLSRPLLVVGLVGLYPTNYLMSRKLLLRRFASLIFRYYAVLARLSTRYSPPKGRFLRVTQPFATSVTHNTQPLTNNFFEKPPNWSTTSLQRLIVSSNST